MSDRMLDDSEFFMERFSCDCGDRGHIMDISIEYWKYEDDKSSKGRTILIDFEMRLHADEVPFFNRFWRGIKYILGKSTWDHGILLRGEDVPNMIDVLEKARISE